MPFRVPVLAVVVASACSSHAAPPVPPVALLGTSGAASTARVDLERTVAAMEARLVKSPRDAAAAVQLADALLRQTRVTGKGALAVRAEQALLAALAADPDDYSARRMLGAVFLSEHRFREAIATAERCLQTTTKDAWTYGVLGDAHLELGEYPQAFDAFDRMVAIRPNAASYSRLSYARELQGDLPGAVNLMRMALDATSPQDSESIAWHRAQLGHLFLETGKLTDARREYAHAEFAFPGHPFAQDGLARVKAAEGDTNGALALVLARLATTPSPADSALAGDLLTKLGRLEEADRQYRLAEAGWQTSVPEPANLVRFLADRGWRLDDAVLIAERTLATRDDIFTHDALAWAYFKKGETEKARAAITRALRTGSKDRTIRAHASAIAAAR